MTLGNPRQPIAEIKDHFMTTHTPSGTTPSDAVQTLDDQVAAAAFRRLVRHLQHRTDAQNVDLMGLAGFCRNCLGDWVAEAGGIDKDAGRAIIYGMDYADWKAAHQQDATPEQIARMQASVAKNQH
jgi:uncharacterized protein